MPRARLTDRRLSVLGGIAVALIIVALVASGSWYGCYEGKNVIFGVDHGCFVTGVRGGSTQGRGWLAVGAPAKWAFNWLPLIIPHADSGPYRLFVLPLWIPALVIAVPTVFFWRRSRRLAAGYCRKCRYNLTGLPEPRCPECGTEFDPSRVPRAAGTCTEET